MNKKYLLILLPVFMLVANNIFGMYSRDALREYQNEYKVPFLVLEQFDVLPKSGHSVKKRRGLQSKKSIYGVGLVTENMSVFQSSGQIANYSAIVRAYQKAFKNHVIRHDFNFQSMFLQNSDQGNILIVLDPRSQLNIYFFIENSFLL